MRNLPKRLQILDLHHLAPRTKHALPRNPAHTSSETSSGVLDDDLAIGDGAERADVYIPSVD
jgi:hypothetical protein